MENTVVQVSIANADTTNLDRLTDLFEDLHRLTLA